MPFLNEALRTILSGQRLDNHANQQEVLVALDSILRVDTLDDFKNGIKTNRSLWNQYLAVGYRMQAGTNVAERFFKEDGSTLPDAADGGIYNLNNNKTAIISLAIQKRTSLALKQANDTQLEAIIQTDITNPAGQKALRESFFDGDGNNLFGEPAVKVANWNPEDDELLSPLQLRALQGDAKHQLLIRKINECDSKEALEALLNSRDQHFFTEAVKTLFGVPLAPLPRQAHPLAQSFVFLEIDERIKQLAAKKALSKFIEQLPPQQILALGLNALNEADAGAFRALFPGEAAAPHLVPADILHIKGLLGARFLPLFAPSIQTHANTMEEIAKSADPAVASGLLKGIPALLGGGGGGYIDAAVTESSLPAIRQAFASQALMLKINHCNDDAALDALTKITNVTDLKRVLSNSVALGYANEPKFQEAFSDTTSVKQFVTAARISRGIAVLAQPSVLKSLIELDSHPEFTNLYRDELAKNETQEVIDEISNYLAAHPDHVKRVRGQALVAYAKTELLKLDDTDLLNIVNAANDNEMQTQANILMGWSGRARSPIDDLVVPYDDGFAKELCVQAAIAKVIKETKEPRDLLAGHDALLENINNFTFNPPQPAEIRNLLTSASFPAAEKYKVQAHLVESLVRNYPEGRIAAAAPPAENSLIQLAKETDLEKFKQLLTNHFGVNNHNWVNKQTMEQVQKAACTHALELSSNHPLRFNASAHPHLFALIINLPLAKQRDLLGNAPALVALAEAESKEEVERVLGGKNLVNNAILDDTVEENKKLITLADIGNSEIAAILVQLRSVVAINETMVGQINGLLVSLPGLDFNGDYPGAIRSILNQINPPMGHLDQIHRAFGLNVAGDGVADASQKDRICSQQEHNRDLIALFNEPNRDDPEAKTIILSLLSLRKTALLPRDRIEGIVADVRRAKTLGEFCKIINQPPGRDYRDKFSPSLERQLSPRAFKRLKSQASTKALAHPGHYRQVIRTMQRNFNTIQTQFNSVKLEQEQRVQLKTLANWRPVQWFNLALQANAKQNALEYGPELREVSKQCDSNIAYLTNLLNDIQVQLDTLPDSTVISGRVLNRHQARQMTSTIQSYRLRLMEQYTEIESELKRYKGLQAMFKGHPDADASAPPFVRHGLLKIMDEAKEAKFDLRFTDQFNMYSKDYDYSQKAARIQNPTISPRPPETISGKVSLESGGALDNFETIDALPAGKFREHTVTYTSPRGETKGMYIEERSSANVAGKPESGLVKYEPSIKLTATKFPPPQDEAARVYFAMAMASQLIANLKEPPTAENPIKLRGSDPELVRYLWTALMVIGDKDKNFKFGKNEIKVISAQFSPKEEYSSWWSGSRWNSDFKKKFTENPMIASMLEGIKEVNQLKFDKKQVKARDKVLQDTSDISRHFKTKMVSIDKDNKEKENDTRATLGSSGPGG